MAVSVAEKQNLLTINDLHERAIQTLKHMNVEYQRLELKNDIQSKVQHDMNQQQRILSSAANKNYSRRIGRC